jgi:RNA polymerase sigma-54 factor
MEMKFGLQMRQTQRLVMTPKLQQALKLLQVPTLELQQILKQEILQNPMLEEIEDVEEEQELEPADRDTDHPEGESPAEATDRSAEEEPRAEAMADEAPTDKEPDQSWDDYFGDGFDLGYKRSEDEQDEFYERVPVAQTSSIDKLLSQLRIATSDPVELKIGEYIIGSLNDSGYVTCALTEIANTFQVEVAIVERVLGYVQAMDPVGIGARDLQESLLIQLRHRGLGDSVAAEIVRDHFSSSSASTEIPSACISVEDVRPPTSSRISILPGFELMSGRALYHPDLIVDRVGEEYVVFRTTRTSRACGSATSQRSSKGGTNGNKETRDFILGRLSSAAGSSRPSSAPQDHGQVMGASSTSSASSSKGPAPLTLQQVASRIGMHGHGEPCHYENKYVQTPRSVRAEILLPRVSILRWRQVSTRKPASRTSGKEDPRRPLSDQKIADTSAGWAIIACRTVRSIASS